MVNLILMLEEESYLKFLLNTILLLIKSLSIPLDLLTSVNTLNNTLGLGSHGLVTGDKVFYNGLNGSVASGLSTGPYYVFRTDDNTLQLGETEIDVFANPPRVVSIASTGGANQELSMINPRIDITKNNTLFFDVSDASLSDYNLKLYYDNAQSNEFVSTGSTSEFSFETSVTNTGVTTSHKVLFGNDLPTKLFYTLEKDGVDIDPDTDVVDYSQILYRNSRYNREYSVFGIGATTFSIALPVIPEKLKYTQDQCKTLKYKTTSKNASGPISKLNILYGGSEYLKLPRVTGIATGTAASVGTNGVIRPDTTTIGKLNQFRILNEGFEYSIDELSIQAEVPKLIGHLDLIELQMLRLLVVVRTLFLQMLLLSTCTPENQNLLVRYN